METKLTYAKPEKMLQALLVAQTSIQQNGGDFITWMAKFLSINGIDIGALMHVVKSVRSVADNETLTEFEKRLFAELMTALVIKCSFCETETENPVIEKYIYGYMVKGQSNLVPRHDLVCPYYQLRYLKHREDYGVSEYFWWLREVPE